MDEFKKAYKDLNPKQEDAVKQIYGPILVIAGPGTGKTQLLSTRVGYILQNTDALPQNILCLTFTEAGVTAMRDRLTKFLGQAAYDVNISTYHAFGSELIRRYPEYSGSYDFEPIDDLGSDSLIREILEAEPYANPLRSADTYARDLREFMSDCKRNLLAPKDLRQIVKNNQDFINKASRTISSLMRNFVRIDKTSPALFERLRNELQSVPAVNSAKVVSLKTMCLDELGAALDKTAESGKTTPITAWKNRWLVKNAEAEFVLDGTSANRKLAAAAEIYGLYQKELARRKFYDYDDMILRAIAVLSENPDFKYTLAEQYQFIMLDEFQDTNPAQLKIVELLTDNPVNEGQPNILAVGDDDQAIYAFQGADHTNMARFAKMYRGVRVISLRQNYRSHAQILDVAYNISDQIQDRLHQQFAGVTKILKETGKDLPKQATIAHHEFISDASHYAWVAAEIKRLTAGRDKIELSEIAVLAPKHRYLLPLLPFLADAGLPVRYEKRENVLDKPIVHQLEQLARLVIALAERDHPTANALWPEILSYEFWGLATEEIWKISWKADKTRSAWTNILLAEPATKKIAQFMLRNKDLLAVTTLEQQLDILSGVLEEDVKTYSLPLRSPFFDFYFGRTSSKDAKYLELLSDLSILRGRLRQWRRDELRPLNLIDFVHFIDAHRAGNINILNSSPHVAAKSAVNVMTAYQAKGREFKAVFILAAQDEVWGSASREQSSNIGLPVNLNFIRYRGGSDDERLRLLYVSITRAKTHLYLTSYAATLDGKPTRPLKYLAGQAILPPTVSHDKHAPSSEDMQSYWHQRHIPPFKPKLKSLLEPVLDTYQLSPTHLNQFTDVIYGGPEQFFLNTILRFPKGQTPSAQFGTAIHDSLKWIQDTLVRDSAFPELKRILAYFDERLKAQRLAPDEHHRLTARGHDALTAYVNQSAQRFEPGDLFEQNFRNEGVFIGKAHLSGKVDKLIIDKKARAITVVDFKTGKSHDKWLSGNSKLHKYRQQLIAYKILVEGSHTWKGYRVEKGVLEFVEPDEDGRIARLELVFDDKELDSFKSLAQGVWRHIQALDFPDISRYPQTMAGIKAFEQDLIK